MEIPTPTEDPVRPSACDKAQRGCYASDTSEKWIWIRYTLLARSGRYLSNKPGLTVASPSVGRLLRLAGTPKSLASKQ